MAYLVWSGRLAPVSGGLPMAEQTERIAAPAGAAPTGQDVLLATKLHVPRPPDSLVARRRLGEALGGGSAGDLIVVSAPAGFGKTSLLADWIRRRSRPAGWLTLDPGDNDPVRFWRHVAAALDHVCPGISDKVGPLLGPLLPASFEGLVTALINALADAAGDEEMLLVLDDYHVIEAGPVHESVGFLIEHRPPGLRLVLASRTDPPLPHRRQARRGQPDGGGRPGAQTGPDSLSHWDRTCTKVAAAGCARYSTRCAPSGDACVSPGSYRQ
jgi:hypothetical protein